MNIPFTSQQVEDMIQRGFNIYRDEFKDIGITSWRQWLQDYGVDNVGATISSEYTLYDLYLKNLPEDVHINDVLEAYISGSLPRSQPTYQNRISPEIGETGFSADQLPWQAQPKKTIDPEQAQSVYRTAIQKASGPEKEKVLKARQDMYFAFNADPDFAEKAGISKSEINKRIRMFSGLRAKDQQLEDNLNHDIPPEHQWIGITNSSFLGRTKVSHEDLDQFVREIDVTQDGRNTYSSNKGETLRRYIANTFLSIDTHIDYKNLGFKIGRFEKKTTMGEYNIKTKTVTISDLNQNTVAHEIGHYLDNKWCEEIGQDGFLSEMIQLNFSSIPEDRVKWIKRLKDFIQSLMMNSDIESGYTQSAKEVFARFVDRFCEWTHKSRMFDRDFSTRRNDKFLEVQYHNFVKLLQEKSYLDAKYPIQTAASSEPKIVTAAKKKYLSMSEVHELPDVDRYVTDDYAINVALQENNQHFCIGIYITNYKVGISGYQQYWHYEKNEKSRAIKTYKIINKIVTEVVDEIKENSIPHVLVKPFLRNRLDGVDPGHNEKSGVYNYNYYSVEAAKEDDWRSTVYGPRYPSNHVDVMSRNWHPDEVSRAVEVSGNVGRNMTYRYKYDEPAQPTQTFIANTVSEVTKIAAKSIPITLNQPKRRSKKSPQPVVRPFDSKQVEVFDKNAKFVYSFEQMDEIKAIQCLYRAVSESTGTSWGEVAQILVKKYKVPSEFMSTLNYLFLHGQKQKWKFNW